MAAAPRLSPAAHAARARAAGRARRTRRLADALRFYLPLGLLLLLALFPLGVALLTAFKADAELARGAFRLPEVWRWQNFADAWTQGRFSDYFRSSIIVTSAVVAISTVLATMTGYAFGRLHFWGRGALLVLFMLGIMVPQEALIIPLYHNLRALGLWDTYWALILPQVGMSLSFGTFWMAGFFAEAPQELADAAAVDGAGGFQTLARVLLPVVQPGLVAMVVLFTIWTWNDFLLALVLVAREELRTLPLGLAFFQGRYTTNVPLVAAAAMIVALPTVLVYLLFQRQFIRGVTAGAVQG